MHFKPRLTGRHDRVLHPRGKEAQGGDAADRALVDSRSGGPREGSPAAGGLAQQVRLTPQVFAVKVSALLQGVKLSAAFSGIVVLIAFFRVTK